MTAKRPAPARRTVLDVMTGLLGSFFPDDTWRPWFLCAAALFGLTNGLDAADQAFIRECMGRRVLPTAPARRGFLIVGRRGGKSRFAAFVAAYLAAFVDYRGVLAPGERGIVAVLAPNRRQSDVLLGYVKAIFNTVPMLTKMVERETADSIFLTNGIVIEVHTANFRTVRGITCVAAIVDEGAFLPTDDSAEPDKELLAALEPAMATVPQALLLMISSPYAKRGELYRAYTEHFGRDGDPVFVWQAPTRTMNATVPQDFIDKAAADDEAVAGAEYYAQFRPDLEALFSRSIVDAVTVKGRFELAPQPGLSYVMFLDPAGGSGGDSFTAAVAHRETDHAVLDAVREIRPPFKPTEAVQQIAALASRYGIKTATSDRYAAEWPVEAFQKHGLTVLPSELNRSDLYLELLPSLNSRRIELLDLPRLSNQLVGLDRRTGRSGRDSVDHRAGSHDDVANCAAGALVAAVRSTAAATLPDTFRWCNRAESIAGFSMTQCYLFGGGFRPPMDACCKNCVGHQFVLTARKAQQERTGVGIDYVDFYRRFLIANDFVAVRRAQQWAEGMGL